MIMKRMLVQVSLIFLVVAEARADIPGFLTKSGSSLPCGTNAFTYAKLLRGYREFRARVDASAYDAVGVKSSAWDNDVHTLLKTYDENLEARTPSNVLNQILQGCDTAIAKGCKDPLVLFMKGYMMNNLRNERSMAEPVLKSALKALEGSRYPARFKFLAAKELITHYPAKPMDREASDINSNMWTYLGMEAADPVYTNGCQRYYMVQFEKTWNETGHRPPNLDICWREVEKNPAVDPWIKAYLNGLWHIRNGMQAQGPNFYALETRHEERWKVYHQRLEAAEECLTKAHDMHPEYPEAAAEMIEVAMERSVEPKVSRTTLNAKVDIKRVAEQLSVENRKIRRRWFDHAVSAQLDYEQAYSYFLWALRPRWGGSHNIMLDFGLECLNTKRFDTSVPHQYLIAVWNVGSELSDWREAYRLPGVYENICRFQEGQMAQLKNLDARRRRQSVMVVLAWAAERYEDAAKLVDELGYYFDASVATDYHVSFVAVLKEIRSRTNVTTSNAVGRALMPVQIVPLENVTTLLDSSEVVLVCLVGSYDPNKPSEDGPSGISPAQMLEHYLAGVRMLGQNKGVASTNDIDYPGKVKIFIVEGGDENRQQPTRDKASQLHKQFGIPDYDQSLPVIYVFHKGKCVESYTYRRSPGLEGWRVRALVGKLLGTNDPTDATTTTAAVKE